MSGASYLRCKHCRGFYETSFARCKWCDYDAPFPDLAGKPRVFPDRETCRAIQTAEYEQLPPEALDDCMGPPNDELTLLCNCLHCGPDGHAFEAVEMRWMANERMWACPCTTCGGRGFAIDIHSAENKWQCAQCGHFYVPENGDYRHENAKCPRCGSTDASGWFDDGYDEEDDEFEDEDFDDALGGLPAGDRPAPGDPAALEDQIPWDDPPPGRDGPGAVEYDLGISWRESEDDDDDGDADPFGGEDRLPDDIDHPRNRDERDVDINEDDIPF